WFGQQIAMVIDAVFGQGSTDAIGKWFSNWRERLLDLQLLFIGLFKGFADISSRLASFVEISVISIIQGFKDLAVGFANFNIGMANRVIDGVNSMVSITLTGVNKVIEQVNKISP